MPVLAPIGTFLAANAGTIAAVGSAASAAMSVKAQNDQAQATMDSAKESDDIQMRANRLRQVQINKASSQEAQDRAAETNRSLGKFMAASGASGLSGVSLARQQAATAVGERIDLGIIEENRETAIEQSELNALGIRATTEGRINTAEAGAVGPFGALLAIGSGAASGYSSGQSLSGVFSGPPKPAPQFATPQGPQGPQHPPFKY